MVNLNHPELKETQVPELPPASLDTLRKLREDACASSSAYDFKLQAQQRFLRRVMSPDSPTQNLLMVHGTGTGKTCTAIQIAEEYILRPEFQDKRVLVLANPAVQDNFRTQIFDISRVSVDADGLLLSKQCTGRRYLDILQRAQAQPLRWTDQSQREKLMNMANRILNEFYEFQGYTSFGNRISEVQLEKRQADMDAWIHDTFDNRLIVVDEAHNLRESDEMGTAEKIVSAALKRIVQTANGVTLVLLTATPMYDTFDEILDYFNMFLWNSRKQEPGTSIKKKDIFTDNGDFVSAEAETRFRGLCENYISFVRGENPFTFPFRLPPPDNMLAKADRTHDSNGKKIATQRKYLTLTAAPLSEYQESIVKDLKLKALAEPRVVCVYPENKTFGEIFKKEDGKYVYNGEEFLAPSRVATYSAKFASVMKCIAESKGIVFVYSNLVESGAQLFSMCLEEHGFKSVTSDGLLGKTSGEIPAGSKGSYALFTSETSDAEIKRTLARLRRRENANGDDIRVIVASPKVSEGVDFRYVRQIHVLDPWFNMSRIEQVIGRGMRTCSHSLLPFEDQNCTVYLHVCRFSSGKREALDEHIYREYAERKAIAIAKVKKAVLQSAMDCNLERPVNALPTDWMNLTITQSRAQGQVPVTLPLRQLASTSFLEDASFECKVSKSPEDPTHVRPLSAILDVKDELLDKVIRLFQRKPIWKQDDLFAVLKKYDTTLVKYILQNAISMGFKLKDKNGRIGRLEAKDGVFMFAKGEHDTMVERLMEIPNGEDVSLQNSIIEEEEEEEEEVPVKEEEKAEKPGLSDLIAKHDWPDFAWDFSEDVLKWYYVDHIMTRKEKINHIIDVLNESFDDAPIYAAPLLVYNDDDDSYFYALGNGEFYNEEYEDFVPIGEQKDSYDAWVERLKQKYLDTRDSYFATLKEKVIVFNVDEKNLPLQRAKRSKNIGGLACTSYREPYLDAFVEWLGEEFPSAVSKKPQRCMYLDLLIRKSVLEKKTGLVWWTPEEWSILSEDANRKDLLKKLK
jgi:hypothetical protein